MKNDHAHKENQVTLKSIETKLRNLTHAKASDSLKNKLFAAIPFAHTTAQEFASKWLIRIWDCWATATAAVLILALMLLLNYCLSIPAQAFTADLKDMSLYYTMGDQNMLIVANASPGDLNWPIEGLNEPGY